MKNSKVLIEIIYLVQSRQCNTSRERLALQKKSLSSSFLAFLNSFFGCICILAEEVSDVHACYMRKAAFVSMPLTHLPWRGEYMVM